MGQHVAYNKDLDCSRLYMRCVGQLITAQRTLVCPIAHCNALLVTALTKIATKDRLVKFVSTY